MIKGRAEKIFRRFSDKIHNSLILSESNTTYFEDFLIVTEEEKIYVQPDNKAKFFYLPMQYLRQDVPNRFLKFIYEIIFRKSQVIRDKDYIFIFAKIQKIPKFLTISTSLCA